MSGLMEGASITPDIAHSCKIAHPHDPAGLLGRGKRFAMGNWRNCSTVEFARAGTAKAAMPSPKTVDRKKRMGEICLRMAAKEDTDVRRAIMQAPSARRRRMQRKSDMLRTRVATLSDGSTRPETATVLFAHTNTSYL
jgi:hypothetical protein